MVATRVILRGHLGQLAIDQDGRGVQARRGPYNVQVKQQAAGDEPRCVEIVFDPCDVVVRLSAFKLACARALQRSR